MFPNFARKVIPMSYGYFVEWLDGRTARVEITRFQAGDFMVTHKVIKYI